jgi:hypothetical protein
MKVQGSGSLAGLDRFHRFGNVIRVRVDCVVELNSVGHTEYTLSVVSFFQGLSPPSSNTCTMAPSG